jgi:hypothetical protein
MVCIQHRKKTITKAKKKKRNKKCAAKDVFDPAYGLNQLLSYLHKTISAENRQISAFHAFFPLLWKSTTCARLYNTVQNNKGNKNVQEKDVF